MQFLKKLFSRRPAAAATPPVSGSLQDAEIPGLHLLFPNNGYHWLNLAQTYYNRKDFDKAEAALQRIKDPGEELQAHISLLRSHRALMMEKLDLTRKLAEEALELADLWQAHEILGHVFMRLHDFPEAVRHYEQASNLDPGNCIHSANLALALEETGRFAESLAALERANALNPRALTVLNSSLYLGAGLGADELVSTALRNLERWFPLAHEPLLNRAFLHLAYGEYAQGFADYEVRFKIDFMGGHRKQKVINTGILAFPRWDGRPCPGKRLLLHCEQGAGDTLMMARFFKRLKQETQATLICECQNELIGLLQDQLPIDEWIPLVVDRQDYATLKFDAWIPSMSLPWHFGITLENLHSPQRYLAAPADAADYWRNYLASFPPGLRIGVAWSGNPTHAADRKRSIPFELFKPLLDTPNCHFFAVQLVKDKQTLPENLIDLTDQLFTFGDTTAVLEAVDLVITVDTSVVHLAGAIGKETWLLFPYRHEWRWGRTGEHSDWYPSVRIFRQAAPGDWTFPLSQVQQALLTQARTR
ncbi:MAG: hypothetical protein RIR00_1485 [Pseudomonadota bacterium]|jgi:Flp pilus assembly protein TadD